MKLSPVRFELTTFGSGGQRAIQLRHGDGLKLVFRQSVALIVSAIVGRLRIKLRFTIDVIDTSGVTTTE